MQVKIKKLTPEAKLPTYAKPGDAAMDVTATSIHFTEEYVEYGTGLAVEVPEGHVMLIFPRSSVSKYDLMLANAVGVVDSGYRNEVKLRFKTTLHSDIANKYKIGDRVGQIMILPYPQIQFIETQELTKTDRGEGGFGSTGK